MVVCLSEAPALAAPCDSLAALALEDAKITSAQLVPAGQSSTPGQRQGASNPFKTLSRVLPRCLPMCHELGRLNSK